MKNDITNDFTQNNMSVYALSEKYSKTPSEIEEILKKHEGEIRGYFSEPSN